MHTPRKNVIALLVLLCGHNLVAQPVTAPTGPQSPAEKTRRFLVRYMNYLDTTSTADSKDKILKGIEMVANTAKTDWISQYQAAYYNLVLAESNRKDSSTASGYMTKAENYIKAGLAIAPDEAELKTLEVFLEMTKAVIPGPPSKNTIGECIKSLEKIQKENPANPRTGILYGECYLRLPEKEGRDKKKASALIEAASKNLESDKHDDPAWPRWGKERAERLLKEATSK